MSHDKIAEAVADEVRLGTPQGVIDAIVAHRQIATDALARIAKEGQVVRTLKGDVIAHPSIKIHADAKKAECALLKDWGAPKLA
jgi:hypothetical protein